ncbi:MAG: sigma-54 dependent transcriptional regulator [Flavobacteriales bacterium]|nr:sigma-54 dependent transcriptional regulator [Flavobacteriales bacterium]MDG1765720.1 sigma-54 dependent transcriptional regulator [Flavobacteriales bacterium]
MLKPFKIFVVEDDPFYGELLEYILNRDPELEVELMTSGKECLKNMYKNPDVVTLDYGLSDMNGLEVMEKIKTANPSVEIIVVSGQEDVATAVNILRNGAYDYLVKDEEAKDRIWNSVQKIRDRKRLESELDELRVEVGKKYEVANFIGQSKPIEQVKSLIGKAISTNITVSITGETGTGKEVVAKAIHYNSTRVKGNFVAVNVAAIPNELIESELFGHEKGAFTGANVTRKGRFEEADKGTLFLDEIGEMNLNMQSKLLRVLQEREVTRVGGNKSINLDVRVLVATHKDLANEVKEGRFREDLYYRLLGLPITLPPLRDRGNDILLLTRFFLDTFAKENKMKPKLLSPQAKNKLLNYSFPGNVRELKAIVELAVVMSDSDVVEEEDVRLTPLNPLTDFLSAEMSLKEYSQKILRHFLDKYDQNVLLVADKLQIGKSTIYRMLKEMD